MLGRRAAFVVAFIAAVGFSGGAAVAATHQSPHTLQPPKLLPMKQQATNWHITAPLLPQGRRDRRVALALVEPPFELREPLFDLREPLLERSAASLGGAGVAAARSSASRCGHRSSRCPGWRGRSRTSSFSSSRASTDATSSVEAK